MEDLFGLAALLPWWAGSGLAVIAYAFLHHHATSEVPLAVAPGQIGQMTRTLAIYGQYLLPLILLAGALASFLGRRKRESLVRSAAESRTGEAVRNMSWRDFELLVGEVFRLRGYTVVESGGGGADGGVDLKLSKGREVFLVQCKQWRAYKVSVNVVRELFGVMAAQGATGGFVVTSGVFTADAKAFAEGRNIQLIDGALLKMMFDKARRERQSIRPSEAQAGGNHAIEVSPATINPTCPRCGGAMTKRIAKQGANAGSAFWGCSGFPKCRGVRSVN